MNPTRRRACSWRGLSELLPTASQVGARKPYGGESR